METLDLKKAQEGALHCSAQPFRSDPGASGRLSHGGRVRRSALCFWISARDRERSTSPH